MVIFKFLRGEIFKVAALAPLSWLQACPNLLPLCTTIPLMCNKHMINIHVNG